MINLFPMAQKVGSSGTCTQTGALIHHDLPARTLPDAATAAALPGRVSFPALRAAARLLCASALGALAACAPHAPKPPAYSPLILISIDGYRADYLARGKSPALAALAASGVRAEALRPAFPTLTFPNHYTIVTGLYPDHHGIVNNRMVDPAIAVPFVYKDAATIGNAAWWGGEPLWVSVEKQGLHAATVFWPGSDVAIDGVRPERWLKFDITLSSEARVAQALLWLDLPEPQRPAFVTIYFDEVDRTSHTFGPGSAQADAAVARVDAALAHLLDGLKQRGLADTANLVVLSDHGQAPAGPDKVEVLDRTIDMKDVDLISTGVLAGLAAKPGHEARVERALLAPHDHMRCWKKSSVPARLHYGSNPRIPPLLCLADDGWIINTQEVMDKPDHKISLGEHGYDNEDPAMGALFVAHGPAFKRGLVVPEFDNVDIYPLLAAILGIKAQPNDGDFNIVKPMLAKP
ncbi:MAG TPA: ectonucleotide pyrophosphatase/phosphodiesterase [Rudaea sp.]|nr:ectonucleotide pyrophosphatase/phosphodiesterase [Rudaea sp.]